MTSLSLVPANGLVGEKEDVPLVPLNFSIRSENKQGINKIELSNNRKNAFCFIHSPIIPILENLYSRVSAPSKIAKLNSILDIFLSALLEKTPNDLRIHQNNSPEIISDATTYVIFKSDGIMSTFEYPNTKPIKIKPTKMDMNIDAPPNLVIKSPGFIVYSIIIATA